jgi:tetratricopeptide (TPR) repeat protein
MFYRFQINASRFCSCLIGVICFLSLLLVCTSIQAQSGGGLDSTGTGGRHLIQGRIYFPSGRRTDVRIKVKLESYNFGGLSVLSDQNGNFRFSNLNPGSYTVVVDAGEEYEIYRESVYIDSDGTNDRRGITLPPITRSYSIQVTLRLKPVDASKPGVVSAALAAIPPRARELYQKAIESAKTDGRKAVEELQSALAIYPDFALALNELGVQFLRLGQVDKAAQALANAVKVAPEDFMPRLNYGFALLNQRKFAEAEEELRVAVKKNSSVAMAHLYLGMTLAIQRKLDEGEKELRAAININAPEMGSAHKYLGGIYIEKREYKRAADELDAYLKLVPNATDSDITRRKIRELRNKTERQEFSLIRSNLRKGIPLCHLPV